MIGEGDPGYLATSRMLAQTAVALAKDDLLRPTACSRQAARWATPCCGDAPRWHSI